MHKLIDTSPEDLALEKADGRTRATHKFKLKHQSPGGGTRVHRSRVGSAGLRDLKILHVLQRLKKGGQNSTKIPQC